MTLRYLIFKKEESKEVLPSNNIPEKEVIPNVPQPPLQISGSVNQVESIMDSIK